MPGDGRTVARTITVIVLVLLATVALGGYLPGAAQPDETQEEKLIENILSNKK